jgi:hypothetical protein
MTITKAQAEALTSLAVACRPTGARHWDAAGVMAAIAKVRHLSLADVALAVIRAADDRTLDTPGPISNPKAHCWRERAVDRPQPTTPYDRSSACGICDKTEASCRANPHSAHDYEPKPTVIAERIPGQHAADIVLGLRDRVAKAQHIEDNPTPDAEQGAGEQQEAS